MNLNKEARAVKRLLDEADQLEHQADLKVLEADDKRWEASERTHGAITDTGSTQGKFATASAISAGKVSDMMRAWKWWLECRNSYDGRPTFYDAVELAKDATLRQRAAAGGKSPTTTAIQERHARAVAKTPVQAREVVKDKAARAGMKRAISEVEAEEDAAEAEAWRQKMLADRDAAGRTGLENAGASTKFGANTQLDASVLLGKAAKALTMFIKLVHDRGPVPDVAKEAYLEELDELRGRIEWAVEALNNRITNWDDALAELTGE